MTKYQLKFIIKPEGGLSDEEQKRLLIDLKFHLKNWLMLHGFRAPSTDIIANLDTGTSMKYIVIPLNEERQLTHTEIMAIKIFSTTDEAQKYIEEEIKDKFPDWILNPQEFEE